MLMIHFILMGSILSIQTTGTGTPITVRERTTAVAEHLSFFPQNYDINLIATFRSIFTPINLKCSVLRRILEL